MGLGMMATLHLRLDIGMGQLCDIFAGLHVDLSKLAVHSCLGGICRLVRLRPVNWHLFDYQVKEAVIGKPDALELHFFFPSVWANATEVVV